MIQSDLSVKKTYRRLSPLPMTSINKADEANKYGFHYFDKPSEGLKGADEDEDDEEEDEFEMRSCTNDCCDEDCECDDCLRCSANSVGMDDEGEYNQYSGAAG